MSSKDGRSVSLQWGVSQGGAEKLALGDRAVSNWGTWWQCWWVDSFTGLTSKWKKPVLLSRAVPQERKLNRAKGRASAMERKARCCWKAAWAVLFLLSLWIFVASRCWLRAFCNNKTNKSPRTGDIRRAATAMRRTKANACSAALSLNFPKEDACVFGQTAGSGEDPFSRQPECPLRKWNLSITRCNFAIARANLDFFLRFAVMNLFSVHAQSYHTRGIFCRTKATRFFRVNFFRSMLACLAKSWSNSAKKKYTPVGDSWV